MNLCMSVLDEELGGQEGFSPVDLPDKLPTPREIREILEISTSESVDKKMKKRMNPREREAMIAKLTAEMRDAAKILEFEHAAYLRDKIQKLREEK